MSNIDLTQIVSVGDKAAAAQVALRGSVNVERERRIVTGANIPVTGAGAIPLQGRPQDQQNLLGLFNGAMLRKAAGDTSASIQFRDRDNALHNLTPDQMIELYGSGAAWVSAVYAASWALKDGAQVPADYASNTYWPNI